MKRYNFHYRVPETLSFEEYLEKVSQNPRLYARTAHQYLYDALMHKGVDENGLPLTLKGRIFGIEEQLHELLSLLWSGAQKQDVRRRIIMLLGPVGSAKSALVSAIKEILEEYSLTEEGAIYAIKGCPMHEDPLRAIPKEARREFEQDFGVEIEGELCPVCQYELEHSYGWDIYKFQVERIYFSESRRIGIATFAPGDPNTQDITDLIGGPSYADISKEEYRDESHPKAWVFSGSLFQANRGLHEFIELLKAKREFLHVLLTLAQERKIKAGRFALIDADMVLLAHTNYEEYERFTREKGNEAIKDRMRVVEWKYNLQLEAETKIYDLMTRNRKYHLEPKALEIAGRFALYSRMTSPDHSQYPPPRRLRIYSKDWDHTIREYDYHEVKRLFPKDGTLGLSPRAIVDAIDLTASKADIKDPTLSDSCVNVVDLFISLKEMAFKMGYPESQVKMLLEWVVQDYDRHVKDLLSEIYVSDFQNVAQQYFKRYLDQIKAVLNKEKIYNPIKGTWEDPDTHYLRSIESRMGIPQTEAPSFRDSIYRFISTLALEKKEIRWDSHPVLAKAIRQKVYEDQSQAIRSSLLDSSSEEGGEILERVRHRLYDRGYCKKCADSILRYASELILREESQKS